MMQIICRIKTERGLLGGGLLFFSFITILFFGQCKPKAEGTGIRYKKSFQAATLSDSSFVSDVRCIRYTSGVFLISDYNRGQVLALNREFRVVKEYGQAGTGPGEIIGALGVYSNVENLYCVNQAAQTIEVFNINSGIHQLSIRLPTEILGTTLNTRFFEQDGIFFLAAPASGRLVAAFDRDSRVRFKFGELIPFETAFETMIRNSSFVFRVAGGKTVVVSDNVPELRFFDSSGNQERKVDLSFIEPVKQRLHFRSHAPKRANSFFNLFEDVYYQDGLLYLLAIGGKEKPTCNEVVILSFDENGVKLGIVVKLDGAWYTAMAVDDSRNMLVYNSTADQLEFYTLLPD